MERACKQSLELVITRFLLRPKFAMLLFVFFSLANGYIICEDYYDIYDTNDEIECRLATDTPANRAKYTEIDHEIHITDG